MKVRYDPEADAAYIQLANVIEVQGVAKTYLCDPAEAGMINLDFDRDGRLIGIEVMDASKRLPEEVLESGQDS